MALTQTMYIRYNTKQDADLASANYWDRLGHPTDAGNVTQFIFQTLGCPNDNSGYVVLTEPLYSALFPKLTTQEQNFITTNMVPASNVQVTNCLNAIAAAIPVNPDKPR
jgi:hypothetical protein